MSKPTMTDAEYQEKRNRLIPAAERFADKACGKKPSKADGDDKCAEWYAKWNRIYFKKMDELAREAGLIK